MLDLPPNVASMGFAAFAFCDKLISIILSDGITYISPFAFQDCTGLTSVTIPRSVLEIDVYAFEGCDKLLSIIYKGTRRERGSVDTKGSEWKYLSGIHVIHCVDGDIEI